MSELATIYDEKFYSANSAWRNEHKNMMEVFNSNLKFSSVADVGCGAGLLLYSASKIGKNVFGLEGSEASKKLHPKEIAGNVKIHDLTQPYAKNTTFDLVTCMEVLEHIPRQYADIACQTICNLAGNHLIISCAIPWQGGTNHVNEQPNGYWCEKLVNAGFDYDDETTFRMRKQLQNVMRLGWWFWQNVMVFHLSEIPTISKTKNS